MASIDAYIEKFHNLKGITIGERRCSFNHYFKDITSHVTNPADVKIFFNLLKPQNRLEEVLYLELLLHYKQHDQLWEILYNEDCLLIKLTLKDGTFVEDAFKYIDAVKFIEFLEKVSFVVRSKVMTKLSKCVNLTLDSHYFAVKEKYGLDVAKNLLSGCSLDTINGELKKHKILFTNSQLTRIYERSNDFLQAYFAHLKKNDHTNFTNFVKIIKMIALINKDLYWTLLNDYELDTKLSYMQTTVVLAKYKLDIIKDTSKYLNLLNKHAVVHSLSTEEFKVLFANILPKTIDEFDPTEVCNDYSDAVFYLSNFVRKQKRFEILQEVFINKYSTNILDHPDLFNELILDWVPVKDRHSIIENKLSKDPPEEAYLAFYETDKALELLKKKISQTTNATNRLRYVEMLIKVCRVNNDMKRWPAVFNYIIKRHKNEDNRFYSVIFRSIVDNCSLPKFDQTMWDTINNVIEGFRLRFKIYEHTIETLENGYMKFKVENNMCIVEDVSKIIKEVYKEHSFYRFWCDQYMLKKCIDVMPEVIPKLFQGKKLSQAVNMYYNTIISYNRDHKKRIDVFKNEFIVKFWEDVIADEKSEKNYIFDDLTFVRSRPDLVKKIAKVIWEGNRTDNYQWRWFLKYQPQDIVKHYEKFFEDKNFNRTGLRRFYYNVTLFSHLGIPQLFYKKSKELLETKDLPGESHQYVAAVKFLVHHEDFVQIVDPLLPKESSVIDPSMADQKNFVEVNQAIARVLGNYKEKSKILDTLAVIAKGDYLQFSMFSMHKIMYHTAEYKLTDFLDKIADGPISLRKHVIFILAGMSTVQTVYDTFQKIGQTETNSSIRTYLLKTTLKYFQLNPIKKFFELTQQHARLLEPSNQEGYTFLTELKNIPMEFISSYIEFAWEFIMEATDKDILDLRYKLLNNITKTIMEQMTDNLLHKIVIKCLNFEKDELQDVYNFVYQYIIGRDIKEVVERISVVVKQLPKVQQDLKKSRSCKNASDFIKGFCTEIINKNNDDKTKNTIDFGLIMTEFSKLCAQNVSFKASVWLNLTKMYLDADHKNFMHDFGHFYADNVNKWSLFIIHILADIFSDFTSTIIEAEKLKPQETLLDFLLMFLKNDSQIQTELFAVLVLPKNVSKAGNVLEKHLEIMQILNNSKSDVVKIAISCNFDCINIPKNTDRLKEEW